MLSHTSTKTAKSKKSGFTLPEALNSLAILASLAAFAQPTLQNILTQAEINAAINEFHAAFYLAQNESIRLKHRIAICPSKNGFSCNIKWAQDIK